jgi:cytidylate kinase
VVIAIDGPSGVGKSTVARAVAEALGIGYLDTGSTYRAATLAVLEAGVDPSDADAVVAVVARAGIAYEDGEVRLGDRPVGVAVRSPEVTAASSAVSAIPEVRRIVVAIQRDWVAQRGGRAVVEGRDIGTVVFPLAMVKVFLTASPEVRAARRAGDPEAAGADVAAIEAALRRRDEYDSTRETSPLQPAADAVIIDTGTMNADEVIDTVLALVAERS